MTLIVGIKHAQMPNPIYLIPGFIYYSNRLLSDNRSSTMTCKYILICFDVNTYFDDCQSIHQRHPHVFIYKKKHFYTDKCKTK